jgi:hypothetical protein
MVRPWFGVDDEIEAVTGHHPGPHPWFQGIAGAADAPPGAGHEGLPALADDDVAPDQCRLDGGLGQ